MLSTSEEYTKTPRRSTPRIPWPLPLRPQHIHVCDSPLATYSIVLGVEAWDKDDPRAVAFFCCQRRARGRAFPDALLVQRVPLTGLTREGVAAIFAQLVAWLRAHAQTDTIRDEARP